MMELDGRWLAEGPYCDTVRSLSKSDPRLRQRDPRAKIQNVVYSDLGVRVSVLEAQGNGTFKTRSQYHDPAALRVHLERNDRAPGRKTVYILEGLGPGFVGVLGHHFSLHPSVFVEHERVVSHDMSWRAESDPIPLPSVTKTRPHLEMRYYEVMAFDRRPSSFRWVCGTTGRHINVSRELKWDDSQDDVDQFLDVGVVGRKCGVWSRRRDGGGWDCLVMCDPPLRRVHAGEGYTDAFDVRAWPYQGGYMDFVPEAEQVRAYAGPPRSCLSDDLTFYLETHSALVGDSDPECVSVFIKKIVASQYLIQIEHVRAVLTAVQRGLTRKQDLAKMPMRKVEALWSDMQGWERRMAEYLEDLESIMVLLGIPLVSQDSNAVGTPGTLAAGPNCQHQQEDQTWARWASWQDCATDFQFILLRLRELRHRTESLNAAVTGLASITGNRLSHKEQQRSIREAKSTKAVTLLGLIFIPLAYTSSLFSMTEPYGPGGSEFWQYFAASAPLIVVVILLYYILDFGYNDGGSSWSLWRVWDKVGGAERRELRGKGSFQQ